MRYAKVVAGKVINVLLTESPTEDCVQSATANIGDLYVDGEFINPKNVQDAEALAVSAIATILDEVAKKYRYDSFASLLTYKDSSIPEFALQATSGILLRDRCWALAMQIKHELETGEREGIELAEFQDMLQVLVDELAWEVNP